MEISALANNANDTVGIEALKKAQDVEQSQVSRVLEGMQEQTQQTQQMQQQVAQNTGLGMSLNIQA
ncbi:MAG: hypothetical protein WC144_02270 [Sulfurimonas sp.]|jgi:K+/H+ antiporter YhaU regulatory subunit KhtT|nr:hypothetical protein [Sulfurimonadaceae bacterium]